MVGRSKKGKGRLTEASGSGVGLVMGMGWGMTCRGAMTGCESGCGESCIAPRKWRRRSLLLGALVGAGRDLALRLMPLG